MRARLGPGVGHLAIALLVLAVAVLLSGPRAVYAYLELRCPPGETAQPVTIAPVFVCRPPRETVGFKDPEVVAVEHRAALYLANLKIRVFDLDFVWGREHWLAWDVPGP